MKKLLSTTGTIILRMTMLAAFVMNIGIGNLWAEEKVVTNYNLPSGATNSAQGYIDAFHNIVTKDGKRYVTMSKSSGGSMNELYIQPSGDVLTTSTDKYLKLDAYSGCYIHHYGIKLGSKSAINIGAGTINPVVMRVNAQPTYTETGWLVKRFEKWTEFTLHKTSNETTLKSTTQDNYNQNAVTFYVGAVINHTPDLRDLSVTIWVPEVLDGTDQKTGESTYEITDKPMSAGGKTKTHSITYDVANGIKDADFKVTATMTSGKGQVKVTKWTFSNQKLIVQFLYEAATSDWECESYTADLVISSVNDFNTKTFTTKINGSGAGNVKSNNTLAWAFSSPQFVNAPLAELTKTNSPSTVIYTSDKEEYAKFETKDGVTTLKLLKATPAGQTVRLTAHQDEYTDATGGFKEATISLDIAIIKRTPEFTFNPTGELYTSRTYNKYVSPRAGNDPNGTMNPTYSSEDENLFVIDASGNLTTKAGLGTSNLRIVVESSDEWESYNQLHSVTVARDPMHVPFCLTADLFNDSRCVEQVTGESGDVCKFESGSLQLGSSAAGDFVNDYTKSVILNIVGVPYELSIGNVEIPTSFGSDQGKLAIQMQIGSSWIPLGTIATTTSNKIYRLFDNVKALKFTYSGKNTVKISDICISEKVGVTVDPEEITLMKVGGAIAPASFIAAYGNMTSGSVKLNTASLAANKFTLSCEGQTPAQSFELDYNHGLGVDQSPNIQVSVAYKGEPNDINLSTIQNPVATITVMGTNGDVAVEKIVNVNIGGVELTPEGLPNIIVSSTAEHPGIYTGTEKPSSTFPYCHNGKTEVNLSATFGTGGKALFDKLYIFGPTTAEGGGNTISLCTYYSQSQTHPNAITPCYIYTKAASGDRYEWTSTIPNMNPNSAEKPLANITNVNGKKLYFTGYCPYASSGSGSQVGVVYIEGGANETVDVYMQNLFLHARYHTADGSAKFAPNDTITLNLSIGTNHIPASASAFVFASTTDDSSSPFSPAIHLLDSNKLDGGMGYIHASILTLHARAGLYSAPIHLYVTGASRATELTIDDKWPTGAIGQTQRTNGILHLCPKDVNRPSVELGGPNSTLNFNGGRIHLKNNLPVAASEYICTFAIAYRAYSRSAAGMTATLCGMGEDQPEGNVNFNDGSIYGSMSDADFNRCQSYYHSKNSIKCPVNTQINGGTFYCDLWSCYGAGNKGGSPKNKYGDQLVMQTLPINNTPQAPYYFATIDFDAFAQNKWCFDTNHDDYNTSMAQYYATKDSYGTNSLKANGQNKVNIMVPYQFTDKPAIEEISSHPWAVAFPTLYISTIGQEENFGGPVTVEYSEKDRTRYLLYAEADTYTSEVTGAGYVAPNIPKAPFTDVTIEMGDSRNDVENIEEYQIEDAQYMMLPIERADRWTLFSPPFDISNVYVVEVENEATLVALAKENKRYEAYTKQATSILDLFYYFGYYTIFTQGSDPFWNTYVYWRDNTMPQGAGGAIPLKHFTGSNYDAHYYLQRSTGIWTWDGTKFTTDWEYLPSTPEKVTHGTTQYDVVMKKGEIYSLKFPYMYDGYIENNQTNWDYWTGKYLILEGIGPQRIKGKNYHATIQEAMSTAPGHAEIRVNSTLAMIPEVDLENARYLEYGREEGRNAYSSMFNPSLESKDIDPTEGFILANEPALFIPGKKAAIDLMSGTVIYEDEEETSYDTPNIVGDHSLLVYNNEDGLAIFPVNPQHVAIYNAAGQLVTKQFMSTETHVTLPAGIYFISGETERVKAMVK